MKEHLLPACTQGMAARQRLAAARDAIYCLLDGLPMHKRVAVADLYGQLCGIQNRLEELLGHVPAAIHLEPGDDGKGG